MAWDFETDAEYQAPARLDRRLRPTQFKTLAVRDGGEWVINGWKFFSSNASTAAFLGASNEMPFHQMIMRAAVMGIADGPTEVHEVGNQ